MRRGLDVGSPSRSLRRWFWARPSWGPPGWKCPWDKCCPGAVVGFVAEAELGPGGGSRGSPMRLSAAPRWGWAASAAHGAGAAWGPPAVPAGSRCPHGCGRAPPQPLTSSDWGFLEGSRAVLGLEGQWLGPAPRGVFLAGGVWGAVLMVPGN